MRKLFSILTSVFIACAPAWAAYSLTASKVEIQDLTVDKPNYYLNITAATTSATYNVFMDVWPQTESIIGSFSAQDGTIDYYYSGLNKDNGNEYLCEEGSEITLTITKINEDTCELSATIQAARKGTSYTYVIAPFRFEYKAGGEPGPVTEDPYRFEPTEKVSQAFNGQIVNIRDNRDKTGWININLIDSLNQKLDWVELDLVVDSFAMPVGTFTFSADSAHGTFIASPGYQNRNDYPSYIAIRGIDWGQYTPYYIKDGSLTFSLNEKGDTVHVAGSVTTQHGSTFSINVTSYNEFYVAPFPPKPKEEKELTIDSVVISYVGAFDLKEGRVYDYEFNFSYMEDYPNLILNVMLPTEDRLTEGTYTMTSGQVYSPLFFQNQSDFNDYFFYGENYNFTEITLTLTYKGEGIWQYGVDMTTDVGSHYYFTLEQNPHLAGESSALPTINEKRSPIKVLRHNRLEIEREGIRYSILGIEE